MISKEMILYSLRSIMHRKTRSILTIFSIFMGITTIFLFISFGWGLYDYVDSFKTSSSADKITIMTKGMSAPGLDDTFTLSEADVKAVEKTLGVQEVTGIYTRAAEIKQNKINKYIFILGYDPNKDLMQEVSDMDLFKGRQLRPGDKGKVLLGYNYMLEDKIFPKPYDLNSNIEIQGQNARVVGFYESIGNPQDDSQVFMTTDYFEELFPNSTGKYAMILARVDLNDMDNVINRVEKSLRDSRNLEKGKEDFYIASFDDLIETYTAALDYVIYFVIFIALISVFVSAVNTANTTITSVLERTREIGVMKAIGARNSDVFGVFLFESGFLGFVAGCVGVFVGFILTSVLEAILKNLGWGFLQPHYSWTLFLGCILFAAATGAISGIWPSYRASKIRTVVALRYE